MIFVATEFLLMPFAISVQLTVPKPLKLISQLSLINSVVKISTGAVEFSFKVFFAYNAVRALYFH